MFKTSVLLENIFFKVKGKSILSDITINLSDPDFISIIGPNGAGKTTFLKILATFLKPTSGNIYLNAKNIVEYRKKDIAKIRSVVFAEEKINCDFLNTYDYISLGRYPYQGIWGTLSTKDKKVIDEIILKTKLQDLLDKDLNKMSSGEKQRLQIAKALIQEPQILLLDEPISHLDIKNQIEIMKLLKELSKEIKIITILHDINMACSFSDYLLIINKGCLIEAGKPQEIINESILETVFGTKWEVSQNNKNNTLRVLPII